MSLGSGALRRWWLRRACEEGRRWRKLCACARTHARTHAFVREWVDGRACVRVGGLRLLELVD